MSDEELGRLLRAHWQEQDDTVTDVGFTGPALRERVRREHVGQVRRLVAPAAAALVAAAAAGVLWLGTHQGHRDVPAAPTSTAEPAQPPAGAEAYLGGVEPGVDVWLRRDSRDAVVLCVRRAGAPCAQTLPADGVLGLPGGGVAGMVDDSRVTAVTVAVDGGQARAARTSASARGPLLFAVPHAVAAGEGPLGTRHDVVVDLRDSRGASLGHLEQVSGVTQARRTPPLTAGDEVALGDPAGTRVWASADDVVCVGTRTSGTLLARRCAVTTDDVVWVDPQATPGGLLLLRLPTGSTAAALDGRALTVRQAPHAVWGFLAGGVPGDATSAHLEVSAKGQVTHRSVLAKLAATPSWEIAAG